MRRRGGRGGGGGVRHHRAYPPPAKPQPNPPNPLKKSLERLAFKSGSESDDAAISRGKKPNPPPPPARTAYEGRRRLQTHQPPPTSRHRPPPPPLRPRPTPKGATAEKKDDRPGDPIVGTVAHVPYPTGVEKGTVHGIHGRQYGAVWVKYLGGTTLYEVPRHLLFPTPEVAERYREEAQSGKKKPKPPPPQTKRLNPRTRTLPPNPLTPLTPHPDPRRRGTPIRGPMRCEGSHRGPMGHNGHAQHA